MIIDEQEKIMQVLESAKANNTRIRVWCGDTDTGEAWPEEWGVLGYVGRSTGVSPVYLLVNNSRSLGGGELLVQRIVRIDATNGCTLYRHPSFSAGVWGLSEYTDSGIRVSLNGQHHATFSTEHKARLYIQFMKGNRYSK